MTTRATQTYRPLLVACLGLAVVAGVAGHAQTQLKPTPFTKDEVVTLLTGSVSSKRVGELVRDRSIDFQITPETESDLRKAGATDTLLAALRDLAPKPPTLVVTTTPGGAQVFVDDELIARTSVDGRLKISTLAAGRHTLRVSLEDHPDYGESFDLSVGKTVEVAVNLDSIQSHAVDAPSDVAENRVGSAVSPLMQQALTFPGLSYTWASGGVGGTITFANEKLQFSESGGRGKHSFNVSTRDIVHLASYLNVVEFAVRVQGKEVRHRLFVTLPGSGHATKTANIEAAKELFEALKASSK